VWIKEFEWFNLKSLSSLPNYDNWGIVINKHTHNAWSQNGRRIHIIKEQILYYKKKSRSFEMLICENNKILKAWIPSFNESEDVSTTCPQFKEGTSLNQCLAIHYDSRCTLILFIVHLTTSQDDGPFLIILFLTSPYIISYTIWYKTRIGWNSWKCFFEWGLKRFYWDNHEKKVCEVSSLIF
jgi:hypothetical protein